MQQSTEERNPDSSELFNVTIEGFKELQEAGLDMNTLFILECFSEGTDITKHISSLKLEAWKQNLVRNGYLNEDASITKKGEKLIEQVKKGKHFPAERKEEKKIIKQGFDLWWENYPSTDVFTYKGKKFEGSRGFRVKKEECKKKFLKIVESGEHTAEEMIEALKCEVLLKKEASIREGDNKMRYMQNSLTYLNQYTYENFIELSKTYKVPTTNRADTSVDI